MINGDSKYSCESLVIDNKPGSDFCKTREYPYDIVVNAVLNDGKPFCLMCYEKSGSFCHRTIVAEWLRNNGIEIKELVV